MIETSAGLPKKSSSIFGNLWKYSERFISFRKIFGNVNVTSSKFWRIFGNLWKVVGNLQKIIKNPVINMSI